MYRLPLCFQIIKHKVSHFMKAIEYLQYGTPDVFKIHEVTKPSLKAKEVLIKVHASTVTAADIMMRKGKPLIGRLYLGISKPKRTILGFEFAGEIVAIGEAVSLFNVGEKVFGGTTCYAQYVAVNEADVLTTMPENLSYEAASPISGSVITVLHFLKGMANIKANQKVLINGASGALGTYSVQFAKYIGAEVTGICGSSNTEMVKSLGADKVIDYTKEDFTQNGEHYDIIFDTVGKSSFSACKDSLTQKGIYLSSVMDFSLFLQMIWTSLFSAKKAKSSSTGLLPVKERLAYLIEIKELLRTGVLKTVIDRHYPLSEMAEAHRYVEKGHKKGNVIITI